MARPDAACVLHADLDAFYASVEQLLDPALRSRPIAVGGGVVLAASYEARAYGVSAGMPAWRARQMCPGLAFVPGHFRDYRRLGDEVMDILGAFTPLVERVSIDEAFLDVAGARRLFGAPAEIAAAIRHRVRAEVGLPLSIGVARTKHLAKVASQVAKPDGMVVVDPDREPEFLARLPVGLIWGVGPVTNAQLANAGIHTIGELAAAPGTLLDHLLGRTVGERLAALAANVDPRRIGPGRPASSMGAQAALGRQRATPELLRATLGYLSDRVAGRLRAAGRAARTVTVRVRFPGLRSVTRSTTVAAPVCATLTLTEIATGLAAAALANIGPSATSRCWPSPSPTWSSPPSSSPFPSQRVPAPALQWAPATATALRWAQAGRGAAPRDGRTRRTRRAGASTARWTPCGRASATEPSVTPPSSSRPRTGCPTSSGNWPSTPRDAGAAASGGLPASSGTAHLLQDISPLRCADAGRALRPVWHERGSGGWHIRTRNFCVKVTRPSPSGTWPR